MKKQPKQKGFIALMSVIIISAILMVVIVEGSLSGFYTRFTIADAEYKERSSALADACVDEALLRLATDASWVGNATTSLANGDQCYVGPVQNNTPTTGKITIKTKGSFQNSYTNLQVVVDASDLSTVSWQEVPAF